MGMSGKDGILIVGADGQLGRYLARRFAREGRPVTGTSRHPGRDDGRLLLDLDEYERFSIPPDIGKAVIAAGVAGFGQCEDSPDALRVNTAKIPALVGRFLEAGVFTVYLSSSAVFAQGQPVPDEQTPRNPETAYGRQKALCEDRIHENAMRGGREKLLTTVRMTKVAGPWTAPFSAWLEAWRSGGAALAFSDVRVSPVSFQYAAAGIAAVLATETPGIVHLSGAVGVTFAQLCARLAAVIPEGTGGAIQAVDSRIAGKNVQFRPVDGRLDMALTAKRIGMGPQSLDGFLADFRALMETMDEVDFV